MKTFKIITFGCRVNQAESREIGEALGALGLISARKNPDLVAINTCCVTGKAEREVRKEIRRAKRENPNCMLLVVGCWINKIKKQKSYVKSLGIDLLISNKDKKNITVLLKKKLKRRQHYNKKIYQDKYAGSGKILIKIQDGCNNFCSYCIVPYVRGRLKAERDGKVIEQIKKKVKEGVKEIVPCYNGIIGINR